MSRLEMLGYIWIFMSLSLSMGLYKLEISKRVTDEEYEYIKRHRAFGNLTKYLSIIAIISILLLNFNFLVYKDYEFMSRFGGVGILRAFYNMYRIFSKARQFIL